MSDIGGSLGQGLAQGLVLAAIGTGYMYASQKLGDWKQRRWEDKHKHLTPEQLEQARKQLAANTQKRKRMRWLVIAGIFFGSLALIHILWG